MSGNTLYVGSNQQYTTIAAAVAASSAGDTVVVSAGTYTNDFVTISHDLTLQANGSVKLVATQQPPDGKAYITEGGSGINVTITGPFDISGVTVPDQNGAAVRYEGGNLTLNGVNFHDNQNGILGAADPNGIIDVEASIFKDNGVGGDGHTHNLYIGDIKSFTFNGSVSAGANIGHEIKSRAENNTITNSKIIDGSSTSSYSIDLPNGGNAVIQNNLIQQGANSQNPYIIAYGEEGQNYSSNSLSIDGNIILNDLGGTQPAVMNDTNVTIAISNNKLFGLTAAQIPGGSNPLGFTYSGNQQLLSEPLFDDSLPGLATQPTPVQTDPTPVQTSPVGNSPSSQDNTPSTSSVYRFFNTNTGSHFYTASSDEEGQIRATRPDLVEEASTFQSVDKGDTSAQAVYRFFNTTNGEHFLTSNQAEVQTVMQTRSDLTYEGVDFYEHAIQQAGDTAVYRFFDNSNGSHLYTNSESERAAVAANPGFVSEGIAFWAPSSH